MTLALHEPAGAAIVMVASMLILLVPLDGRGLGPGRLLAGAGLIGALLVLFLGVAP